MLNGQCSTFFCLLPTDVLQLCCWPTMSMRDLVSSLICLRPLANPLIPSFSFVHNTILCLYFGYRIFRAGTVLNKKCMESGINSQALISAIAAETTMPKDNKNISDTSSSMLVCSLAFCWMQRQMKGLDYHIQNLPQIWIWLFEELSRVTTFHQNYICFEEENS